MQTKTRTGGRVDMSAATAIEFSPLLRIRSSRCGTDHFPGLDSLLPSLNGTSTGWYLLNFPPSKGSLRREVQPVDENEGSSPSFLAPSLSPTICPLSTEKLCYWSEDVGSKVEELKEVDCSGSDLTWVYSTSQAGDMPTRDEMAKKRFCTFTLKKLAGIGSKKGRSSSHSALRLFPTKQGSSAAKMVWSVGLRSYLEVVSVAKSIKRAPCGESFDVGIMLYKDPTTAIPDISLGASNRPLWGKIPKKSLSVGFGTY
ncbi:hypothetical protein SLEP1_g59726 [Rubroshorea leprosula]|uniref:Uncharacterized protein n=1 Tax=Rubroshorea leprosula TaxID=152421 RepID=A0AAV5MW33_9ROSI|nr:hypothetical protein SLEP1_g59726 [Rubroshorea leprosula]